MKSFIKIFSVCISVFAVYSLGCGIEHYPADKTETHRIVKLKLVSPHGIKQFTSDSDEQFDLSGMVFHRGMILVVADKEWNRHIYRVEDKGDTFTCSPFITLCPDSDIDFEGIDHGEGKFYITEENRSDVYEVKNNSCKMMKLEIPWNKSGINRSDWGNRGLEGVAMDTGNNVLFLAKEREPRNIFRIDLKSMEITEPFREQLALMAGNDITDLKYENGFLYILERRLGRITRINVKTGELFSASFNDYVFKDGRRLFKNKNPQYGMAEAFAFKDGEIWVGLDNNGDRVSDYGRLMGLKEGNKTAILLFKRPEGF